MCNAVHKMASITYVKAILGVLVQFPSVDGFLTGTSEIVYGNDKEANGYNLDPSWILYDAYGAEGIQQSSILQRPWKKSPSAFSETEDVFPFYGGEEEYSGYISIVLSYFENQLLPKIDHFMEQYTLYF